MPRVKWTPIKPIRPLKMDEAEFKRVVRNALRTEGRKIRKEFEETTKTWDHKVEFREHTHLAVKDRVMSVEVETDDLIYHFVSGGTKPHPIEPKKKGGVLVFRAGYKAKTTPRIIGSGSGGSFGGTVFAKRIPRHPGTTAREFPRMIRRKRMPKFYKAMLTAWTKAVRATGLMFGG